MRRVAIPVSACRTPPFVRRYDHSSPAESHQMNRLLVLALPLLALLVSTARPADDAKSAPRPPRGTIVVTDEARRIHQAAIVIDGHNDLPWELRRKSNLGFETV